MDKLSYIDAGIISLLILLSLRGIWQGFVAGLASLLGILLGVFFASRFYHELGGWIATNIYDLTSPELNALVGFLIIFILIWSVFSVLGAMFSLKRIALLRGVDNILGLALGFCKAFILLSIIIFGISQINWLKNFSQNLEQNSALFPVMKNLAVKIMNLEQVQEVKDNLNPMTNNLSPIQDSLKEGVQKAVESAESLSDEGAQQTQNAIEKAEELKEQAQDKAQEMLNSKPANSTTTGQ